MPLPSNGSLSLLGYSRPGDTVQSRPKQAMIVRMSVETLDALETFPSQPQLDFEFGDMPGLYIGDKFFNMRPAKEETPHELYLRASSAAKKMAPLKLYATVIGKFFVERELGEGVHNKIRESTQDAVNQRLNRTTILLESLPDIPVASKKRKEPPSLFRRAPRPSDQAKSTSTPSSTAVVAHTASPVPRQAPRESGVTFRKKVIHLLAVNECTFNEVLRKLEIDANPSARREILELLSDVAEGTSAPRGTSDKAPTIYRLKSSSWREVRPYEWPLSEQERTGVARSARLTFKNLGIPENDPIWSHVKYRSTINSTTVSSSSSGPSSSRAGTATSSSATGAVKTDAPKRGVSSKEVKEKMMKPKADRNADIKMKDESARALKEENARVSREESASTARSQISSSRNLNASTSRPQDAIAAKTTSKAVAATAAAAARKPGSGFKMSRSPSNDGDRDTLNEGRRQPHVAPRVKREAHPAAIPPPAHTRPAAPSAASQERRTEYSAKKYRDEGAAASDSERDRYRPRDREKPKERARVREKEEGEHSEDSAALKRRKHVRDADDYDDLPRMSSQKRRKTDMGLSKNPPSRDYNNRESGLPSKPDVEAPSRKHVKRERSPSLPISRIKKDISTAKESVSTGGKVSVPSTAQSVGDKSSKSSKSNAAKARRRSPKYTSSEEEGERPRTSRREQASTLPPPPSTTTSLSRTLNNSSSSSSSHNRLPSQHHPQDRSESILQSRTKKPLPNDHASLRDRYNASYLEYLTTFQKLVAQKGKIDSLLKNNDAGSVTDSDGDVELLDLDELARLTTDHKQLEEELEAILRIFPRAGKDGSGSD